MSRIAAPPIARAPGAVPSSGAAPSSGTVPSPGTAPSSGPSALPGEDAAQVELPVASVVLEVPLAHLDHSFDYAVPAALAADAVPGSRVKVRFAGRLVSGFVVARTAASEHPGRLSPLSAVVSPEPVLSPDVLELARRVAARCAGTTADVLRLAVPPRHARVEAEPVVEPAVGPVVGTASVAAQVGALLVPAVDPGPWGDYSGGPAFLTRLAAGDGPRAVLAALPGDLPGLVAAAVGRALAAGRGSVVVVPDVRDVELFDAALTAALGSGRHVVLTSEIGPAVRYRRWLAVRRGRVTVVLGTRAAAFAPVADPGLFVCYDDGDDLLAEPRAPYCHARDVLALRATRRESGGAGLLLVGHAVSAAGAALLRSGFAQGLAAPRELVRQRTPRVAVAGADTELARDPAGGGARMPGLVLRTVRDALLAGPVLVQTPRAGYRPSLTCDRCREPARCPVCTGPLAQARAGAPPSCQWCGRPAADHRCPTCRSTRFRSRTVGSMRTAEELGRAFPGVPVLLSGGVSAGSSVPVVPDSPVLVIATPGAEPPAPSGYAAAALLDGLVALDRPELAAAEEAARRWFGSAALVRAGAPVVLVAPADQRAVQALVRWDPFGFADAELAERVAARLPPAAVVAELTGPSGDVADLLARVELPADADVLGPVPVESQPGPDPHSGAPAQPTVRAIVRIGPGRGAVLTRALRAGQAARSVRKTGAHVRIRIDPTDLG